MGRLRQGVSHGLAYRLPMKRYNHAKTGFGLEDKRHSVAERGRRAIARLEEMPPRRNKTGAELLAEMIALYPRTEKRPLAA